MPGPGSPAATTVFVSSTAGAGFTHASLFAPSRAGFSSASETVLKSPAPSVGVAAQSVSGAAAVGACVYFTVTV